MATESFTATDGTELVDLGNWNNANALDSDFIIQSNALRTPFNRNLALVAYYSGTFPNDQAASARIVQVGSSLQRMGVAVRCSPGNGYFFQAHLGGWELSKLQNYGYTLLDQGSFTLVDNDDLYLEIVGQTLVAKRNATILTTLNDASHTSGNPGVSGTGEAASGTYCLLDTWVGGAISAGGSAAVQSYYRSMLVR